MIGYLNQSENARKELKAVRDGHGELDKKILLMGRATKATEYNYSNLEVLNKKWLAAEEKAIIIGRKIEQEEENLLKNAKKEQQSKKSYFSLDKKTIELEEQKFGIKINPNIQRREKIEKTSCVGMEGYESEKLGEGLKGEYFDNEMWIGNGKDRIDQKIDFLWKGGAPIDGVNPYNFSIRWTGFIKAPFSGDYKFIIESTDSVMLTFNNKVEIAHNMKTSVGESINRNNVWLQNEIYMVQHPDMRRDRVESKTIKLIGGSKYK